nr:MAG TPA: Protein of unknown function (DUF3789) [Caudoviricetes sp.]
MNRRELKVAEFFIGCMIGSLGVTVMEVMLVAIWQMLHEE